MLSILLQNCTTQTAFAIPSTLSNLCPVDCTETSLLGQCACTNFQSFSAAGVQTCDSSKLSFVKNQPFVTASVPTAKTTDLACDGLDGGFLSDGTFVCGRLLPTNTFTERTSTLCTTGSFIPEFQVCWPTVGEALLTVAQKLCPLDQYKANQSMNSLACQYQLNHCFQDDSNCRYSQLYQDFAQQQQYIRNTKNTAYKAGNENKYDENVYNLSYTVSTEDGEILLSSKLYKESLDVCTISETGISPLLQHIRASADLSRRQRLFDLGLITRRILHKRMQRIRNFADPDILLYNMQDFRFGAKFQHNCRISEYNVQKMLQNIGEVYGYSDAAKTLPKQLYFTIYAGNSYQAQNFGSIVPIIYKQQQKASAPLFNIHDGQFDVLNYVNYTFTSSNAGIGYLPQVIVDYKQLSFSSINAEITTGNLHNRDTTMISATPRKYHGFAKERNYVNVETASFYRNSDQEHSMSARSAILLIIVWFLYLLVSISQMRKTMGVNRSCARASSLTVSVCITAMFSGVGCAFLIDIGLMQILRIYDIQWYISTGNNNMNIIKNWTFIGTFIFVPIILIQQYLGRETPKFVIFDHGDAAYYYRRVFVVNALQRVLKQPLLNLHMYFYLLLIAFFALDLQYSDGLTFILNPHYITKTEKVIPTTAVILFTGLVLVVVQQLCNYCKRQTQYDKFADALSLANCSVLIFDSKNSAHFVYGRSPNGDTDISGCQLQRLLIAEAEGGVQRRGLHDKSAQSFRVYFNDNNEELVQLYEQANELSQFKELVDGQCGKIKFDQQRQLENSHFDIFQCNIRKYDEENFATVGKMNEGQYKVLQQLKGAPVRFSPKFARIFDFCMKQTFSVQTSLLVVSDPTRNFSQHVQDSGRMLPGGLGGPLWLSSSFLYGRWWSFILMYAGIAQFVVYLSGNEGAAIIIGFIGVQLFEWYIERGVRRNLGACTGLTEGMMVVE